MFVMTLDLSASIEKRRKTVSTISNNLLFHQDCCTCDVQMKEKGKSFVLSRDCFLQQCNNNNIKYENMSNNIMYEDV